MQGDVEVRRDSRAMGLSQSIVGLKLHLGKASDPCMMEAGEGKTRVELFLIT